MPRVFESSSSQGKADSTSEISTSSKSSTLDSRHDADHFKVDYEHAIETSRASTMSMSRNDIRKSKSKVRSYLRRCKDVLYGHSMSSGDEVTAEKITVKRDLHASNTSWYLAEMHQQQPDDEASVERRMSIDHLPEEMKTNQIKVQEANDHTKNECNELMPLAESQVNKVSCAFLPFVLFFNITFLLFI